MSEKKGKKSSLHLHRDRLSLCLAGIILSVIAASAIIWAVGDSIENRRLQKERDEIIAQNDIRDIFSNNPKYTDDDPDTYTVKYFLTDSPNYKETGHIKVQGLMLHSIAATMTDAREMSDSFGGSDFRRAGVHGFIDSESGVCYQTLPWSQQAWHAGDGASDYIGVELCETKAGYYTDDYVFKANDLKEAQRNTRIAYEGAVKLFARLCLKYEFDPLDDGRIISHYEGAMRGIATNHGDPDEYWKAVESGYTMDGFRKDVRDHINNNITADLKYAPVRQIMKKYIYHENP